MNIDGNLSHSVDLNDNKNSGNDLHFGSFASFPPSENKIPTELQKI